MPFFLHTGVDGNPRMPPEVRNQSWDMSHESSLNGEEMLAMAEKIKLIKGLMSESKKSHIFWEHVRDQIKNIQIPVTKGIHEVERVHFNIWVERSATFGWDKTVEVFVAKSGLAIPVVTPAFTGTGGNNGKTGMRNLFDYNVTGLTVMIDNVAVSYPSYFEHGYHSIDRRKSFSLGNSSAPTTRAELPKGPAPVKKVLVKK